MTDVRQPLVISTSDPDLRVLNPEVLDGAGVLILPPGVEWMRFPPDEPEEPAAEQRLRLARQALIDIGYFTEEQVGDDIAPRIHELWSALRAGALVPEPYPEDDVDATLPASEPTSGPQGRCTSTHPDTGLQCDGPAGHLDQHAVYDNGTGFTRTWTGIDGLQRAVAPLVHAYVPGDLELADTPVTVCEKRIRPGMDLVVVGFKGKLVTHDETVTCEDCQRRTKERPAEAARNGWVPRSEA